MIVGMLLVGCLLVVVVLVLTTRSEVVPWLDQLTRLNPGVVNRAEWMAPATTVEQVKRDYMAFYAYATRTLQEGWVAYARDLNDYLSGEMLKLQRESLSTRLQHDRGRSVGILRADHALQVRHFSADGLQCVLVDVQTDQRMATYDYWTGERLSTQDLGDAVYVYLMRYDQTAGRWKLHAFVQSLPKPLPHPLDLYLPKPYGRDS